MRAYKKKILLRYRFVNYITIFSNVSYAYWFTNIFTLLRIHLVSCHFCILFHIVVVFDVIKWRLFVNSCPVKGTFLLLPCSLSGTKQMISWERPWPLSSHGNSASIWCTMKNVLRNKKWNVGKVQVHVDPPPIQLIKIRTIKIGPYCVKIKLCRYL